MTGDPRPRLRAQLAWVRACLDEEERIAQAAAKGTTLTWFNHYQTVCSGVPEYGQEIAEAVSSDVAAHFALHGPAGVLARVDATRRRLDILDAMLDGDPWQEGEFACELIPLEVAPFADRPGYQEAWRS